jgi:hypothetical protein
MVSLTFVEVSLTLQLILVVWAVGDEKGHVSSVWVVERIAFKHGHHLKMGKRNERMPVITCGCSYLRVFLSPESLCTMHQ